VSSAAATKIRTEEGTFILFFKIKAWMSGRHFLAYFFAAVGKEVRRQQAKHYNQKSNNRSALRENKPKHKVIKKRSLDPSSTAYQNDEIFIF